MVIRFLLGFVGVLGAAMPGWLVSFVCWICGRLVYYFYHRRRRILLSNLDHAFPNKNFPWKKNIAKTSCARMIELGFLAIAGRWFSEQRVKRSFTIDSSVRDFAENYSKKNAATIILVPHFSCLEAVTTLPLHLPGLDPSKIGVLYRSFPNPDVEAYIKHRRERFGFRLLSRKNGLLRAKEILRNAGILGLLFDQNAGKNGLLTTFFGRIASSTGLPDIFHRKFNARVFVLFPRRTGLWKAVSSLQELDLQIDSTNPVAFAMNRWLEKTLASDDEVCADWLWMHNRWRSQYDGGGFLHVSAKRIDDLPLLERKTRIFIRFPNWLGDVLMALPVVKAVSRSRRDAYLTIIAKKQFCELLKHLSVGDGYIPLPEKGFWYWYFCKFFHHRKLFPDFYILLTNSFRGDLEARIIGCPGIFGIGHRPRIRPLLTECWEPPSDLNSESVHQRLVIQKFFESMGLNAHVSRAPLVNNRSKTKKIALICGSENFPEKRWPIRKWCELIDELLKNHCDYEILLIGTDGDAQITRSIKDNFSGCSAVTDLAGKTSLIECLELLATCSLAIGNDTGGIHLANMAGCPVLVIYGPTNPLRTGPIFDGQVKILKKSNDPASVVDISRVNVSDVIALVEDIIPSPGPMS
ncbi:MAG: hypothetical protein LBB20_02110 [Puniceicoccales bacterium]|jgi:ADP-heptose:LPS heptosyltransferase/lauroyl/myristoyl acyltransferase|nr:hypothetical protein [Puniceicoccales bacterium]